MNYRFVSILYPPAFLAAILLTITISGFASSAPGDMVLPRNESGADLEAIPASVFPHWIHRIEYRCDACHNRMFEMKLGSTNITMETIGNGQHCGNCHNGEQAFAVGFATCNRCHAKPED